MPKVRTLLLGSAPSEEALAEMIAKRLFYCDVEDICIADGMVFLRDEVCPEYVVVRKKGRVRLETRA